MCMHAFSPYASQRFFRLVDLDACVALCFSWGSVTMIKIVGQIYSASFVLCDLLCAQVSGLTCQHRGHSFVTEACKEIELTQLQLH